jgi:hypothetical protein
MENQNSMEWMVIVNKDERARYYRVAPNKHEMTAGQNTWHQSEEWFIISSGIESKSAACQIMKGHIKHVRALRKKGLRVNYGNQ